MSYTGVKVDCETLLSRFQETDSVRFEDFLKMWQDVKFSNIFLGGMRSLEMNKFTKESFAVACLYFLPPYTFQIRVGALYLLYGLYNTQLCQPKQKIRIALKDWHELESFHQDLLNAQHLDAVYIFRQMRLSRAFHFTGMPTLLTFKSIKKPANSAGKEEFKDIRDKVKDLVSTDTLEEMLNIHEHYQKTKCLISADKSKPDKALSLIKDGFVDSLKNLVTEHQQWKKRTRKPRTEAEEKEASSQESEGSERARALAKIKSKSYNSVTVAPKSRRHRQVEMASVTPASNSKKRTRQKGRKSKRKTAIKQEALDLEDDKEGGSKRKPKRTRLPVIPEEDSSSSSEEMPVVKQRRTSKKRGKTS
ncbi:snRNA-activating protein complex subunit 1 [Pelobates fuscus]|uniref:snRNA-activating protein complex subunit 1 n=1 Tax=Pelobates fuscus TaxID=191477 RepID=UPI002FE490BE